jgi:hypothetical protein
MSLTLTAVEVESVLNKALSISVPKPFNLDGAQLYGVTVDNDDSVSLVMIDSDCDVYDLLSTPASVRDAVFNTYALVTTGWAAPLNNGEIDGPPSEHEMRRRVRLAVVANADNAVCTVLRFEDEPEETVLDEGQATGSLASAVSRFVTH